MPYWPNVSKSKMRPDPDSDDTDANDVGDRPVASVQRALLVLDCFVRHDGTLTLAELTAATSLDKDTVARILSTLEQQDYIVRTRSGEFRVGPKPLRLANRFQRSMQLEDLVLPVLRDLVGKTQESASYSIPQGQVRIILYRVNSPLPIRDHRLAGEIMPLDRGAGGHIFSAFVNAGADAEAVRERMIAVTKGEVHSGMAAMASPVFNGSRICIGAVGLSGPAARFTPAAISRWEPLLLQAAKILTRRMGGDGRLFDRALGGNAPTTSPQTP
jgi:DNA-binding IclR family transcriptional regulator